MIDINIQEINSKYYVLIKLLGSNRIYKEFSTKVKESYIDSSIFKDLDKHTLNIAINYMHNTTLSLYKAWVNDNKTIPFNEIVELNYNFVINGLSGLTKNTK